MEKLKVLSLFCGCGGMDLGLIGGFEYLEKEYRSHCFDIVCAYDNDPYCTQIYNANFSHQCEIKDVRSIEIDQLPDIDMLIGGFPCQSFSISAQNPPRLGYKDERGMLFFEMVKILKAKQPRFFIAENVKGILSANQHKAFPMIIKEFEDAGYKVRYQLLNANNYGVPQKRERVIIVGFRDVEDYARFNYPPNLPGKKYVLGDVVDINENENERLFFSDKAVAGMMAKREKMNKGRAQSLDEPCNTISSHLAKVSLNSTDPVLLVNGRYRRFSCREAARIQSFPETFLLDVVSEGKQYKAIGNAVPPVLMWHVAEALQKVIDGETAADVKPYPKQKTIQLSLFEPRTLYCAIQKPTLLLGCCRTAQLPWIEKNNLYNYPIMEEDKGKLPLLRNATQLIIRHRTKNVGYYRIEECQIVNRRWLKDHDYPTKSSTHKADTEYILYTIMPLHEEPPHLTPDDCRIVLTR